MATGSIPQSYDRAQRAFHWIMAGLILLAIAIGVIAWWLPERTSPRVELLMLHKSLGMTVLALAILRIVYRAVVGAPPYGRTLTPLMRAGADFAHFALYALMIALPVIGYVASTAGGHEVSWFGLFVFPALAPQDKALGHLAAQAHFWLGWIIITVLALHFAAAAWHLWVKRDDIFARMWPGKATFMR
ncbi:MAG: cytochrome b [Roseiarcus sp.]|jgi:cytochrome b561